MNLRDWKSPSFESAAKLIGAGSIGVAVTEILTAFAAEKLAVGKLAGHAFALAGGALLILWPSFRQGAAVAAIAWLLLFCIGFAEALRTTDQLASWVPAAEAACLAAAFHAIARFGQGDTGVVAAIALFAVAGAMLVLFGLVHVAHADAIAGMIPAWIPTRAIIPYLTGTLMILAGAGVWTMPARPISALVIASMFLGWLPVVHAARLVAEPTSLAEWSFASMALALAGSLLLVARVEKIRRPHAASPAGPAAASAGGSAASDVSA